MAFLEFWAASPASSNIDLTTAYSRTIDANNVVIDQAYVDPNITLTPSDISTTVEFDNYVFAEIVVTTPLEYRVDKKLRVFTPFVASVGYEPEADPRTFLEYWAANVASSNIDLTTAYSRVFDPELVVLGQPYNDPAIVPVPGDISATFEFGNRVHQQRVVSATAGYRVDHKSRINTTFTAAVVEEPTPGTDDDKRPYYLDYENKVVTDLTTNTLQTPAGDAAWLFGYHFHTVPGVISGTVSRDTNPYAGTVIAMTVLGYQDEGMTEPRMIEVARTQSKGDGSFTLSVPTKYRRSPVFVVFFDDMTKPTFYPPMVHGAIYPIPAQTGYSVVYPTPTLFPITTGTHQVTGSAKRPLGVDTDENLRVMALTVEPVIEPDTGLSKYMIVGTAVTDADGFYTLLTDYTGEVAIIVTDDFGSQYVEGAEFQAGDIVHPSTPAAWNGYVYEVVNNNSILPAEPEWWLAAGEERTIDTGVILKAREYYRPESYAKVTPSPV